MEEHDFGWALLKLRQGFRVYREGWNGKEMYLKLQIPDAKSKMTFAYPYFTIPNCEEGTRLIPYSPTIVDIMSDDWELVE